MKIDLAGISIAAFPATYLVVLLTAVAALYPMRGVADESPNATSEEQTLPPLKSSKDIYYPEAAKRAGLEGKVLVAFDIIADGHVANLSIISADEGVFENAAKQYISGLRFEVPGNWANSDRRYRRYHMGFVFCIPPSSLVAAFGVPASPVTISTNRIPGSPVRNPPIAGATGVCATGS
jgi:TonB family protein